MSIGKPTPPSVLACVRDGKFYAQENSGNVSTVERANPGI